MSLPYEFPRFYFIFRKGPIVTLQPNLKIEIQTINRYAVIIRTRELVDFEHPRKKV